MKKLVGLALLAVLALGSACGGDTKAKAEVGPLQRLESGLSKAECAGLAQEVENLFDQFASIIPNITTQSEIDAAVETGRGLVTLGRTLVAQCGNYDPANALKVGDAMDELEDTLDSF